MRVVSTVNVVEDAHAANIDIVVGILVLVATAVVDVVVGLEVLVVVAVVVVLAAVCACC